MLVADYKPEVLDHETLTHSQRFMSEFCRDFFSWEGVDTPSQFLEKYIELPPGGVETKPGKIDFTQAPYLREPIDAFADPDCQNHVSVYPTRGGKTFTMRGGLVYFLACDPCPMLWYDATQDMAEDVAEQEIKPLIDHNPVLSSLKPKTGKDLKTKYTNKKMKLGASVLRFRGAQDPKQAAGLTARVTFGNEAGKWRGKTAKEANCYQLTKHRSKSFQKQRKNVFSSTPTVEDDPLWQDYLAGDQRNYFVPCPHPECGEMQTFEWGSKETPHGMKWEGENDDGTWDIKKVTESAHYVCKCCGGKIHSHDRKDMLQKGEWRPTNPNPLPGHKSWHINGIYMLVNSFADLAVAFLNGRSSGSFIDRQDFWNSTMGMPWVNDLSNITIAKMRHLELTYERGSLDRENKRRIPILDADGNVVDYFIPSYVAIGADEQSYGKWWVCRAFDWVGNSYLVDWGKAGTYADLEEVQTLYGADNVIIDTNWREGRAATLEAIYERTYRGWVGAEGHERVKEFVVPEFTNPFLGGRREKEGRKVNKLKISTWDFKNDLHQRWKQRGSEQRWFVCKSDPKESKGNGMSQVEYYEQLLNEKRKQVKTSRGMDEKWIATGDNHYFDCEVYLAALYWLRIQKIAQAARTSGRSGNRVVGSIG